MSTVKAVPPKFLQLLFFHQFCVQSFLRLAEVFPGDDELHIHLTHTLVKRENIDIRRRKRTGGTGKKSRNFHVVADDRHDSDFAGGNFGIGSIYLLILRAPYLSENEFSAICFKSVFE